MKLVPEYKAKRMMMSQGNLTPYSSLSCRARNLRPRSLATQEGVRTGLAPGEGMVLLQTPLNPPPKPSRTIFRPSFRAICANSARRMFKKGLAKSDGEIANFRQIVSCLAAKTVGRRTA